MSLVSYNCLHESFRSKDFGEFFPERAMLDFGFAGGYVEASILGQRRLKLLEHQETYEFTSPNLQIRLFPNAGTAWAGATTVTCKETGLEAVVNFKSKAFFGMRGSSNKVSGKVFEKSSGNVLYELNGCWDG